MGDYTSRMTSLLGEMRRERNGAVAEALDRALPASLRYGLNLGVSLPSVRAIARKVSPDHGFSKYLYRQDVRELRLAALWIAEPACVGAEELSFWMRDPMPSELIEELAFALLSRAPVERELMEWLERPEADFAYAAVMALARGAGCDRTGVVHRLGSMLARHPADLRLAQMNRPARMSARWSLRSVRRLRKPSCATRWRGVWKAEPLPVRCGFNSAFRSNCASAPSGRRASDPRIRSSARAPPQGWFAVPIPTPCARP